MIRVLLVDDERLARAEMRRLLAMHPQVQIVGEAGSAAQGIAQVAALDPDLVLLDLQMPGGSGFDLLDALDAPPEVIFTAASDRYPPHAYALDYLFKPVQPQQLAAALQRAAVRLGMAGAPRKLFIREGERCWFVRLTDIHLFESEGAHTRAYFDGAAPLIARALPHIEQRLDPQQFYRASGRHIVNLADVRRIEHGADGAMLLNVAGMKVELGAGMLYSRCDPISCAGLPR